MTTPLRRGRAEISRSALLHNLEVIRTVAGDAKICAVVKANAYGHGVAVVAPLLAEAGVDYFGVALVDEAMELRSLGITTPILVLGEASPGEIALAVAHDITITVGSTEGATSVVAVGGTPRVHVKVDTGMHRQGLTLAEVAPVVRMMTEAGIAVEGLYTHFPVADADDDEGRAFTADQVVAFDQLTNDLAELGLLPPITHLANSAGLVGHEQSRASMVRPGLALYGYAAEPWLQAALDAQGVALRPVLSLKAGITATRRLPAGARPSYGRRAALAVPSTVVTVPFGYADGFMRSLFAAQQEVLINGQRWPLAGVVTMDQLLVNVGDLPVALGDAVVLLGEQGTERIDATEWARHANTIVWEVLCAIGARVTRVVVA